ncbi:hypothetical protein FRACYDRAFT_235582 [Fragilariopsis cylindrus CCMP1102]|uniref:Uncharacterized protein n=1 Tax=Fragilariopsis cylindrus CCMP1102 TaxID=635003 RepID=A0A1E7FN19_9STRA|nr:hypothetical protein FRACYDRAFT_235582 [Fragilariopsis cylindrus CCMP1102]|eukprot:OEU19524.1 hypothetical protein FRACYDRAFT_235582 [Fragilariopsis cylindrus CCMP1102]
MKLSVTTSIILIATSVFPVEGQGAGIFISFQNSPVLAPTPKPSNNPTEQPSNNQYEANANGCVNYRQGTTDDFCQNASLNNKLFEGNRYRHSYECDKGYACCESTIENQSNVQDLGQCTRNYQEDDLGCIKYDDGYSDQGCFNAKGFNGNDYSYSCQGGDKPYICCNSEEDFKSNVQNQGQCQRNSNRRNLRRRA